MRAGAERAEVIGRTLPVALGAYAAAWLAGPHVALTAHCVAVLLAVGAVGARWMAEID